VFAEARLGLFLLALLITLPAERVRLVLPAASSADGARDPRRLTASGREMTWPVLGARADAPALTDIWTSGQRWFVRCRRDALLAAGARSSGLRRATTRGSRPPRPCLDGAPRALLRDGRAMYRRSSASGRRYLCLRRIATVLQGPLPSGPGPRRSHLDRPHRVEEALDSLAADGRADQGRSRSSVAATSRDGAVNYDRVLLALARDHDPRRSRRGAPTAVSCPLRALPLRWAEERVAPRGSASRPARSAERGHQAASTAAADAALAAMAGPETIETGTLVTDAERTRLEITSAGPPRRTVRLTPSRRSRHLAPASSASTPRRGRCRSSTVTAPPRASGGRRRRAMPSSRTRTP